MDNHFTEMDAYVTNAILTYAKQSVISGKRCKRRLRLLQIINSNRLFFISRHCCLCLRIIPMSRLAGGIMSRRAVSPRQLSFLFVSHVRVVLRAVCFFSRLQHSQHIAVDCIIVYRLTIFFNTVLVFKVLRLSLKPG